jgi:hypothetical protein
MSSRENHIADAMRDVGKRLAQEAFDKLPTCMTCLYFDETSETCTMFNARPPARVIAYGCPSHDPLPFEGPPGCAVWDGMAPSPVRCCTAPRQLSS